MASFSFSGRGEILRYSCRSKSGFLAAERKKPHYANAVAINEIANRGSANLSAVHRALSDLKKSLEGSKGE